jgi:SsrA-binding protein
VPRETGRKLVAQNKRARYDYHIEDTWEAGMVLQGTEVKSLRAGRASLVDGYAMVRDGEVWLMGVHIPEYTEGTWTNHEPRRARKLLLHRREIGRLVDKTQEHGLTLIPLSLYFKDGKAKVEIAVGRGKRAHDKRQAIAKREAKREIERADRHRTRSASGRGGA